MIHNLRCVSAMNLKFALPVARERDDKNFMLVYYYCSIYVVSFDSSNSVNWMCVEDTFFPHIQSIDNGHSFSAGHCKV